MIVTSHFQGLQTLAQVCTFVSGNEPILFTLENRQAAKDEIVIGHRTNYLHQLGIGEMPIAAHQGVGVREMAANKLQDTLPEALQDHGISPCLLLAGAQHGGDQSAGQAFEDEQ
jgi:hypothetical protein